MDLARIELAPAQCECAVIPLYYRPLWTHGESNPGLLRATEACYRYTMGPFYFLTALFPSEPLFLYYGSSPVKSNPVAFGPDELMALCAPCRDRACALYDVNVTLDH